MPNPTFTPRQMTLFPLTLAACRPGLFRDFIRHSTDTHVWKYVDGTGALAEQPFLRDWDAAKRERMEENLRQCLRDGDDAFAAWDRQEIAGYCIVKAEPMGSRGQYRLLYMLQISKPYRGCGLGRQLFALACAAARERGAEQLVISSSPSAKTVAFYRRMDCTEAREPFPALLEAEPEDYLMECVL